VLSSLTSYLIYSKRVCIPQVGTFELQHQPATLNFADRLIYSPVAQVIFNEHLEVPEEQLLFLSDELNTGRDEAEKALVFFGKGIKKGLAHRPFTWNGFGELSWQNDGLVFNSFGTSPLLPVAANKIIRENAHHGILVGEKEMSSSDTSYIGEQQKTARSYAVIIGWVVALLALAFIIYWLYISNFHPFSSGLQQKITAFSFIN